MRRIQFNGKTDVFLTVDEIQTYLPKKTWDKARGDLGTSALLKHHQAISGTTRVGVVYSELVDWLHKEKLRPPLLLVALVYFKKH